MKQDIRDLFKDDDLSGKTLPEQHRQEFYEQLKANRPRRTSKLNTNYLFKVAAMVVLFVALAVVLFSKTETVNTVVEETPIETQIDAIEKQYLANIDAEWERFIKVANDEKLVKRYRVKLDGLDQDYQEISKQFKLDNNNIQVIESLVDNLKTRLQLLKDIQEHIKLLNQKNEQYETISI
ncbi:hypothetical protein [Psychroserpens sp. SPM9]|uniref:hypothetical protein n=1 Tax=Psychroserpens sp. SPM9 TaxID=2975598 RepID=UPI0021A3AA54|nr:hypothetical protein [Psychroserpens sp. SPM9]MDG5492075.1 hypothetical protein [Psychroserpens sp. SPM9]